MSFCSIFQYLGMQSIFQKCVFSPVLDNIWRILFLLLLKFKWFIWFFYFYFWQGLWAEWCTSKGCTWSRL